AGVRPPRYGAQGVLVDLVVVVAQGKDVAAAVTHQTADVVSAGVGPRVIVVPGVFGDVAGAAQREEGAAGVADQPGEAAAAGLRPAVPLVIQDRAAAAQDVGVAGAADQGGDAGSGPVPRRAGAVLVDAAVGVQGEDVVEGVVGQAGVAGAD